MIKKYIDEYLTNKLRTKIQELVELNLDENIIMSLMSNDMFAFEDYQSEETLRFTKYLIWLKEKNKDSSNAFEKYKHHTGQEQKINQPKSNDPLVQTNNPQEIAALIEQRRREQAKIEALSNQMISKINQNKTSFFINEAKEKTIEQVNNSIDSTNDLNYETFVDELFEDLSDEEIDKTLSMIVESQGEDLEATVSKFLDDLQKPINEDTYGINQTLNNDDKFKLFADELGLNDAAFSETINNVPFEEVTIVNDAIDLDTTDLQEITFADIVDEGITLSSDNDYNSFSTQSLLDDYDDDTLTTEKDTFDDMTELSMNQLEDIQIQTEIFSDETLDNEINYDEIPFSSEMEDIRSIVDNFKENNASNQTILANDDNDPSMDLNTIQINDYFENDLFKQETNEQITINPDLEEEKTLKFIFDDFDSGQKEVDEEIFLSEETLNNVLENDSNDGDTIDAFNFLAAMEAKYDDIIDETIDQTQQAVLLEIQIGKEITFNDQIYQIMAYEMIDNKVIVEIKNQQTNEILFVDQNELKLKL